VCPGGPGHTSGGPGPHARPLLPEPESAVGAQHRGRVHHVGLLQPEPGERDTPPTPPPTPHVTRCYYVTPLLTTASQYHRQLVLFTEYLTSVFPEVIHCKCVNVFFYLIILLFITQLFIILCCWYFEQPLAQQFPWGLIKF